MNHDERVCRIIEVPEFFSLCSSPWLIKKGISLSLSSKKSPRVREKRNKTKTIYDKVLNNEGEMLHFGYTCERIRVYAGGHTMYILYAVNLKEMGKEKKYMTWVWGRKAGSLEEAIRSQANLKQLKEHLKDIWELYQWLIFKYSILSLSLSLFRNE